MLKFRLALDIAKIDISGYLKNPMVLCGGKVVGKCEGFQIKKTGAIEADILVFPDQDVLVSKLVPYSVGGELMSLNFEEEPDA